MFLISSLIKLFAEKKEEPQIVIPDDAHPLWEDAYFMIEFIPKENLIFLEKETMRIQKFGEEHFDGKGFNSITPIGEPQIKTIDKLIDITSITETLASAGLKKIVNFVYQGRTLLTGEEAPIGYGTNNFAIMCEEQNGLLQALYISGRPQTEEERMILMTTLNAVGQLFDFYLVNWYNTTYYNLSNQQDIENFVKNSI